jgi:hypothetical protein
MGGAPFIGAGGVTLFLLCSSLMPRNRKLFPEMTINHGALFDA